MHEPQILAVYRPTHRRPHSHHDLDGGFIVGWRSGGHRGTLYLTGSPPPALPTSGFAVASTVTLCLASSSVGHDSAPMTAASPALGGGVVLLHSDAPPPAGSAVGFSCC